MLLASAFKLRRLTGIQLAAHPALTLLSAPSYHSSSAQHHPASQHPVPRQPNRLSCHYETLGITPVATRKDVQQAFRSRALLLHPDVQRGTVDDPEAFIRISAAYEVLSDAEARRRYDLARQAPVVAAPGEGSASRQRAAGPMARSREQERCACMPDMCLVCMHARHVSGTCGHACKTRVRNMLCVCMHAGCVRERRVLARMRP